MKYKKRGKKTSLKSLVFLFLVIGVIFVFQGSFIKADVKAYWSSTNPQGEYGMTEINDITVLETPHPEDGYYYFVVRNLDEISGKDYSDCGGEEDPGCVYFEVIEEDGGDGFDSSDDGIRYHFSSADTLGDASGMGGGNEVDGWVSNNMAIAKFNFTSEDFDEAGNEDVFDFYFRLNASTEWGTDTYNDLVILEVKDYSDDGEKADDYCYDNVKNYSDYETKQSCEKDLCEREYDGIEGDECIGEEKFMGFFWNYSAKGGSGECQAQCVVPEENLNCFEMYNDDYYKEYYGAECFLGDNCNPDSCECIEGSSPTGEGNCTSIDCSPDNDCWVTGDACDLTTCTCEEGLESEDDGYCGNNQGCFANWNGGEGSSECFWGDNCNPDSCECIEGSIPNDDGSCTSIDCSPGKECWVTRDECNLTTCTCFGNLDPYEDKGYCTEAGLPKSPGSCNKEEDIVDGGCSDGYLDYNWTATIEWSEENKFTEYGCSDEECCQEEYEKKYPGYGQNFTYDQGACRYDPDNLIETCVDGSGERKCPTGGLVPFFSFSNFFVVLLVIGGIYFFFWRFERTK